MSEQQKADLDATLRQAPLDLGDDLKGLPTGFEELMRHISVADDVRTSDVEVSGVGALEVTVDGTAGTNVALYLHGGVYVIGTAAASVPFSADLARRTGAKVVIVNYRLAPEHPYPAAIEDAKAAYEGLLAQ